jgi:flavin reductase (DIM6/NTAB) family NADH-FMN oxidoreductase RutF
MNINIINYKNLWLPSVNIWKERWFVLTSGDNNKYNSMTIAWGSAGLMWDIPFVQVVVRPGRYTYEFMEKYNTFTVCSFPEKYKKDLGTLGSRSGRDCDKISETHLTIVKSQIADAPCFKEADLVFECKKMYFQDMDPANFLSDKIIKNYPNRDFHRIYFGEILQIRGTEEFIRM